MTPDQEKLLRHAAKRRDASTGSSVNLDAMGREIAALADVLLETLDTLAAPQPVEVGGVDSMRWKLRQYVTEYLTTTSSRNHDPHEIVDGILAHLGGAHDSTFGSWPVRENVDQGQAASIFRQFIQAIRRGE